MKGLPAQTNNFSCWLPRPSTFRPVSAPAIRVDSTVAELIDGQQRWKERLIHDSFAREDAEAILKIPLPKRPKEDQLIWHYDRRGKYSVTSGYQVAMRLKFPDQPCCSSQNSDLWGALWKLVVPEKIKIFLWRASNNILPTSENLWKRRVVQEPICQICSSNVETISHALLGCKMAKKIWRSSQFPEMLVESKSHDISGMFQGLTKKQHISKMETVAALLWVIWTARNKWLFEGRKDDPISLMVRAESIVEAFRNSRKPLENFQARKEDDKANQWCPPPKGWLKVNVDAAVDEKRQVAGLGVVVRDWKSNCIAAAIKTSRFFRSVSMVEAAAMEWGMQVAARVGGKSVLIESDSHELVELVNNRISSMSEIVWVILEILEKKNNFQNFKAQHTPRLCNGISHSLAKLALQKKESVMWLDEIHVLYLISS